MSEPLKSKWLEALRHHTSPSEPSVSFVSGPPVAPDKQEERKGVPRLPTHARAEGYGYQVTDKTDRSQVLPAKSEYLGTDKTDRSCLDCRLSHPGGTFCDSRPARVGAVIEDRWADDRPVSYRRALHCPTCCPAHGDGIVKPAGLCECGNAAVSGLPRCEACYSQEFGSDDSDDATL
jgi:hypothetical protein